MQIVINNKRRPSKEGLYFTEDTAGTKYITRFRDGNWQSQTGHPVEKWIDNNEPSFTIEDMLEAYAEGRDEHGKHFEEWMREKYNIDSASYNLFK